MNMEVDRLQRARLASSSSNPHPSHDMVQGSQRARLCVGAMVGRMASVALTASLAWAAIAVEHGFHLLLRAEVTLEGTNQCSPEDQQCKL